MKLYFSPGACSLAPHVALREAQIPFEPVRVDLRTKQLKADGGDFFAVNEKGFVPVLELDSGERLTEVAAILQYLGDQRPEAGLVPAAGTMERYRAMEWLNFIATELHKSFSPLFNPRAPEEWKVVVKELLANRFAHVVKRLEGREFALGDRFSVVDAYLYTVLRWSRLVGVDLAAWPVLEAYVARMMARPSVAEALKAEGVSR